MKHNMTKRLTKKLAALGLALTLMLALGGTVLAETEAADATSGATSKPAASTLTDEEKTAARTAARTTYDAAVDAALAEIVAAGGLAQEAVDSYHALRDAERLVEKIDTSAWTAEQLAAFKKAVTRDKADESALADLVSQGMLTEADVAALKLAYGTHVTLSDLMHQVDTTKADPTLVTAITDARAAFGQALQDAGLMGVQGKGDAKAGQDNNGATKDRGGNDAKGGRGNGGMRGNRGGSEPANGSDDSGAPTEDGLKS